MSQAATAASQLSLLDILTVVGFVVSVIGGALGAFSIVVTWNLYRVGNSVNIRTLELLGDVRTSSHATEVASGRHMEQLLGAIVGIAQQSMSANVSIGRTQVVEQLKTTLKKHQVADPATAEVLADVDAIFRGLEYRASAAAARLSEHAASEEEPPPRPLMPPALPRLIRWLVENEQEFKFYSVKFVREKVFRADPAAQEALQYAIDRKVLELYKEPNPKDPPHPVTACRLVRGHPITQQILRDIGG